MHLEDHIGDVIAKERFHQNLDPGPVAEAAGLTEAELAIFEDVGRTDKPVDCTALATTLGLKAERLQRIAEGWTPADPDLSRWRELRCVTTDEGMAVNNYLVWDEVTKEAALFDTGWRAEPTFRLIEEHGLTLAHIFITHTHRDHVAALAAVQERHPRARLHTGAWDAAPQHRVKPNDFVQLGSLRISNRSTPGHAADGVTYLIGNWPEDAPHVAIVGDAIFAGSMGRGNVDARQAKEAVQAQIFSLPDDTLICPGHGPFTTVGEEKANNPFF